ncbi:TetR/AcrR family transcriptional regulator C-terminal domain-containing protein [Streptomyces sp. SL13]|jgi:AcrR family transcriptional regulator|uniref:TetR/AcrR family transcriptional regulator C-terminal domain-containing protein n=1 Tax=Streptantibioticus silvisoli TaxID=2705255 RepID=A0AA90H5V3_9ACTN|nr:TetR/AcrR family transcriptional regulator C-terminal domain-containing protein [Streptantibioticus silvisoli]MDI5967199.1 TetR/AcrR family transcriptional regulator C-terminal domain-containing protein [Streptantibioticus silvisoli]MDI5971179.1 TetR/AcrR family transcriptional regulator C-terminal domain-containing protein [Streptantibioticus silvisoli]
MTTSSSPGRSAADRTRPRTRAPRNTLNRERVLDAAVDLLDRAGPDAFTMRALAERLGVATMAVYSHFSGKDEIIDAVRVRLLAEADLPSRRPEGGERPGPREEVRELCRAAYRLLADHPSVLHLLAARPPDGDEFTLFAERTLEALLRAGLERREAASAYTALTQFTVGAALWAAGSRKRRAAQACREAGAGPGGGTARPAGPAGLPADRYPHLVGLMPELADAVRDGTAQYERGLDALLTGLLG